MYACRDCMKIFNEPETQTYLDDSTEYMTYCPYCGSEDIYGVSEDVSDT